MAKRGRPGFGKEIKTEILAQAVIKANGKFADAARVLGTSRQNIGQRVSETPAVQEKITDLLTKGRVTIKKIVRRINEGLDSEEIKFFAHEGKVKSKRIVCDRVTRHKYIVTGLQLLGYLKGSNGMCEHPAGGDVHLHHTQVFQDINLKELGEVPYADCLRQVTDRLSRQRS